MPCAGAEYVDNVLAWLTILTRLADPAPLNPFKQLCIEKAAFSMDWESSRYVASAYQHELHRCMSTHHANHVQVGAVALGGGSGSVPRIV